MSDTMPSMTNNVLPERIRLVFCEWELIGCIFPLGRGHTETKTFVHRKDSRYALTRYLHGRLIGHIVITQSEFAAIGDLI